MNKLILFFIIFFSIIFSIVTKDALAFEVKILKKINNEIITNIDVNEEYNYLLALNNNLKDIDTNTAKKISEESLLREIIKLIEIKKFIDVEKFSDDKSIDKVIGEIILSLNIENIEQFSNYLSSYNLDIDKVRKKILVEFLWNQLISARYENKVIIDKKKISDKIKDIALKQEKIKVYELFEIVFEARDEKEFLLKNNEIEKSISSIGFKNTASKFSISNSAKFGGSIGKINQSQLTDKIKTELNKVKIKEHTIPINIGSGFLILYIENIEETNQSLNEDELFKKTIEFEKKRQLENFSQIYYNKVKINTLIYEY